MDPNYKVYIQGLNIYPKVSAGIGLANGGGIPELERFLEHFRQYKIVVYTGLFCDEIMFEGRVETTERQPAVR